MKKKILVNFFSKSKKWPRRVPKVKKLTGITINKMQAYFDKKYYYNINLILSELFFLSLSIKEIIFLISLDEK